jgi:hypothetical protein
VAWIEAPAKDNSKGKSMIARRARLIGVTKEPALALSNQRLLRVGDTAVPPEESSKTIRLLKLHNGEMIQALI